MKAVWLKNTFQLYTFAHEKYSIFFVHCLKSRLYGQFFELLDINSADHNGGVRLTALKLRKLV